MKSNTALTHAGTRRWWIPRYAATVWPPASASDTRPSGTERRTSSVAVVHVAETGTAVLSTPADAARLSTGWGVIRSTIHADTHGPCAGKQRGTVRIRATLFMRAAEGPTHPLHAMKPRTAEQARPIVARESFIDARLVRHAADHQPVVSGDEQVARLLVLAMQRRLPHIALRVRRQPARERHHPGQVGGRWRWIASGSRRRGRRCRAALFVRHGPFDVSGIVRRRVIRVTASRARQQNDHCQHRKSTSYTRPSHHLLLVRTCPGSSGRQHQVRLWVRTNPCKSIASQPPDLLATLRSASALREVEPADADPAHMSHP